jgi:hypothetical protein
MDPTRQNLAVDSERRPLPLILSVEVRNPVLAVVHPNFDAKECGYDRHGAERPGRPLRAGLASVGFIAD